MGNMPTLHDIIRARPNIYPYLKATPLFHYPTLGKLVGTDIWIKHENQRLKYIIQEFGT